MSDKTVIIREPIITQVTSNRGLPGKDGEDGAADVSADAGNITVLGTDSKILTPGSHPHVEADITDLDKYTAAQVDSKDDAVKQYVDTYAWLVYTSVKTALYAASIGEFVLCDPANAAGQAFQITMPLVAQIGDRVGVKLLSEGVMTIGAASIERTVLKDLASSATLFSKGDTAVYQFGPTGAWQLDSLILAKIYTEVWQAVPSVGIGTTEVIQWTFVPLYPGQVSGLFDYNAGVFTSPLSFDNARIEIDIESQIAFQSGGNNTGASSRVDFVQTSGAATNLTKIPYLASFQSSRAGSFPMSGSAKGIIDPSAIGNTYQANIIRSDVESTMTLDLVDALLYFSVG